jgi:hypothetical protein
LSDDDIALPISADCIFEGSMLVPKPDASFTLESQGIRIEGRFNVCVHNTLLDKPCSFFSLLEAAKCLTASYGLILPDDSVSLRKSIVDFMTTHLDTYCEGRCLGLSGTWREEIALYYFPENQKRTSPKHYLKIINCEGDQEQSFWKA